MRKLHFVSILSSLAMVACGLAYSACDSSSGQIGVSSAKGGEAGQISISQGGNGGSGTASGVPPTGDANCGSTTSSASRQPADVLLVLDRSGSMADSTAADQSCNNQTGCTARWPALTSAVDSTLTATAGAISWGLKFFSSSGDGCTVTSGVEVPISATSVSAIETQISNTSPGGNTPTEQAIEAATTYYGTVKDGNNHVILLATDGEPNCAPTTTTGPGGGGGGNTTANVQGTIDAITAAKTAGIPVYVIGIGPSVGNLDSFAKAGGTTSYFPATTPQDLTAAFSTISKSVATCTFSLASPPPDPNDVAVYLNKNLVDKDPTNGWAFGASDQTIVLAGTSCATIMSSTTGAVVQILFGCPGVSPPTNIP